MFGLAAGDELALLLSAAGRGLPMGDGLPAVPVVPAAILFDITNGGDKDWGETGPYAALGRAACEAEFPAEECVEQKTSTGHSFIGPLMAGFFLSQMMGGNRAGLAQQTPQASPALITVITLWVWPARTPSCRAG